MRSGKRIALLSGLMFALGTGSIVAYQNTPNTVVIVDNGKTTQYETKDVYVNELLKAQGITLSVHDTVEPAPSEALENGMKIVIDRIEPEVEIIINGKLNFYTTTAETVEQLLLQEDIFIEEGAELSVPLDTKISDDLVFEILTYSTDSYIEYEEIPFETEIQFDDTLDEGVEKVLVEGANGTLEHIVLVEYFGGEKIAETVTHQTTLHEVQNEIIVQGTKKAVVEVPAPVVETKKVETATTQSVTETYTLAGVPYEYVEHYVMETTAYTHQPGDRWYNQTASGMPTFVGMIAVDRSVIPFGTVMYVEGYGIGIAGDTGGAIKGNKIDLYFDTYAEAIQFGRQQKNVYILADQTIDVLALRGVK
ncbi:MAG: hypothetical protein ATN36_03160 [Epulopiscium sp. Nele67-Bin005]|nr:MAG: hypothetical protein ATN36_03160 [Epulopiscium sp. Nele67-Bin005]